LVLRDFISRAEAMGIDYNIIEAIDQPWKNFEGSVGKYWGMFNDAREQKFAWTGPITDPDFRKMALSLANRQTGTPQGRALSGKTVGLIGLGGIGGTSEWSLSAERSIQLVSESPK